MNPPDDIDLGYRPSYWDPEGLLLAPTANLKGTLRRRAIGDADELDAETLGALLTDPTGEVRAALGRVDPAFMGGEYLPDTADGEVEIARVELKSVTGDVFSVRARPDGPQIRYRVVDEYDTPFNVEPEVSEGPLTLGELIALIDGAHDPEYEGVRGPGLLEGFWQSEVEYGGSTPQEAVSFATAESVFYPTLGVYYRVRGAKWAAGRS